MKTEFKVGETFNFGLVKLKVEKANYGGWESRCNDCEFQCLSCNFYSYEDYLGECKADLREDKTDVIFVKVEE